MNRRKWHAPVQSAPTPPCARLREQRSEEAELLGRQIDVLLRDAEPPVQSGAINQSINQSINVLLRDAEPPVQSGGSRDKRCHASVQERTLRGATGAIFGWPRDTAGCKGSTAAAVTLSAADRPCGGDRASHRRWGRPRWRPRDQKRHSPPNCDTAERLVRGRGWEVGTGAWVGGWYGGVGGISENARGGGGEARLWWEVGGRYG